MACEHCQQLRDQLRAALLEAKLGKAAGIAITGLKHMAEGMGHGGGSVVAEDRGADADVQQTSGSGVQVKRARRGPRNDAATGQGREHEGENRIPSFEPDGVDRDDASDQSDFPSTTGDPG